MQAEHEALKVAVERRCAGIVEAHNWLSARLGLVLGWVIGGWPATAEELAEERVLDADPMTGQAPGWDGVRLLAMPRLLRNANSWLGLAEALKATTPDREALMDLAQLFALVFDDGSPATETSDLWSRHSSGQGASNRHPELDILYVSSRAAQLVCDLVHAALRPCCDSQLDRMFLVCR